MVTRLQKPSDNEEEHFTRLELERRREWERERQERMAADEKVRLRELHHMKCPKCGMDLTEIEFRGIQLDRCVTCNGTWFDAGEIEKLVQKESQSDGLLGRILSVFREDAPGEETASKSRP